MSPILADTQPRGRSLLVSNDDKWPRVKVARWQLPHHRGKQVFLALRLGALAPGSLIMANRFLILVLTPLSALSPFPRLEYQLQRRKPYPARGSLDSPRPALRMRWEHHPKPPAALRAPTPPLRLLLVASSHLGLLLPQGLSALCSLLNVTPRDPHPSCLTPNALTSQRSSLSACPLPGLATTLPCLFGRTEPPPLLPASLRCQPPSVEMPVA